MNDDGSHDNKREFSRVETHPRARLVLPTGEEIMTAFIIDVCLGGVLIEGECELELDAEVAVTVMLGEDAGEQIIEAIGKVVRCDARGIAVEFTELENIESLEHLKKLILYNSQTPEPIEEEFRSHSGISRKSNAAN